MNGPNWLIPGMVYDKSTGSTIPQETAAPAAEAMDMNFSQQQWIWTTNDRWLLVYKESL